MAEENAIFAFFLLGCYYTNTDLAYVIITPKQCLFPSEKPEGGRGFFAKAGIKAKAGPPSPSQSWLRRVRQYFDKTAMELG